MASAEKAEELSKLSVAELKKRLFFAGVSLPAGHLEKAEIVELVAKLPAPKSSLADRNVTSAEDLGKLHVAELKKRLFWLGATLPSGHLEKADLVAIVQRAEAESADKAAKAAELREQQKRPGPEPSVLKPEPRPINWEQTAPTEQEQQTVNLHLLSEDELKQRIEENGHTLPEGTPGKHFLVALCKQAMKSPKEKPPPKPEQVAAEAKRLADEEEEEQRKSALVVKRRPTVGDRVVLINAPSGVGHTYKIIKDTGGVYPYRLAGGDRNRWYCEDDVCWPELVKKPPPKVARSVEQPVDKPTSIMIMLERYGCLPGDLFTVKRQSSDGKSWVIDGGKQVPKKEEGVGWARVAAPPDAAPAPPPPPPPPEEEELEEEEEQAAACEEPEKVSMADEPVAAGADGTEVMGPAEMGPAVTGPALGPAPCPVVVGSPVPVPEQQLDRPTLAAAAAAGAAAAELAASSAASATSVVAAATQEATPVAPAARGAKRRATPTAPEGPATRRPSSAATISTGVADAKKRRRARQRASEVVISDGEDDVCAVAPTLAIDDDDEEGQQQADPRAAAKEAPEAPESLTLL